MNQENCKAKLEALNQYRTHWSGVITNHLSLALTINVAIISYFLNSFIEARHNLNGEFSFLFAMFAITSIIFGLWRINTRYIDNVIVKLYPEILSCEFKMGYKKNEGLLKYLSSELRRIEILFKEENMNHRKRIRLLTQLIKDKRIGTRGHNSIDFIVFIVQITMMLSLLVFVDIEKYNVLNSTLLISGFLGLVLTLIGMCRFQKRLRNSDLLRIKTLTYEKQN